jgi:hypothetical protein
MIKKIDFCSLLPPIMFCSMEKPSESPRYLIKLGNLGGNPLLLRGEMKAQHSVLLLSPLPVIGKQYRERGWKEKMQNYH